ncbi:hypothetical protein EVAR_43136_1 [Eumeta japonica]|uniref:Uncharacterized protein n=1 Tax=Eumeta variegata TaxID=151549 RepID=A0A4C1XS64_EUMVA|nr:hypothetical protein EVAR_43136_1 [Eumeta japonica]
MAGIGSLLQGTAIKLRFIYRRGEGVYRVEVAGGRGPRREQLSLPSNPVMNSGPGSLDLSGVAEGAGGGRTAIRRLTPPAPTRPARPRAAVVTQARIDPTRVSIRPDRGPLGRLLRVFLVSGRSLSSFVTKQWPAAAGARRVCRLRPPSCDVTALLPERVAMRAVIGYGFNLF